MHKIRTLIVDDSPFMRLLIFNIIKNSDFAEVVGIARDGIEAVEKVMKLHPDVIVLDILMPKMDGIAALTEIMRKRPTPTIIFSILDRSQIKPVLEAFKTGAVDFLKKPGGDYISEASLLESIKNELLTKVKFAAGARIIPQEELYANFTREELIPKAEPLPDAKKHVIVIGASTGGPRILPVLLKQFPSTAPPILIVQHMPVEFTEYFANSLNAQCMISITEASSGVRLRSGHAYVAKGGYHLEVISKQNPVIQLTEDPPVNYVRPAVDVTLSSVAKVYGKKVIAIILTGMGNDGVAGMKAIKDMKGTTIAQ
ncbi:MAG: chemotaxis-specific protein-glutamate methyltransferase CheB, partial [Candidatus Hodarchaeota archaeon]